jgi:hypothetical protein
MTTLSRTWRIAVAAVATAALLLMVACAGEPETSVKAAEPSSVPASGQQASLTVKLIAPTAGEAVSAGSVKVAVETTGLQFTMASNTNIAGEGHVHFTLDDRPFVMSIEPQSTLEDVEPGTHRLVAELVQNNTESFDPPVKQEIEFTAL